MCMCRKPLVFPEKNVSEQRSFSLGMLFVLSFFFVLWLTITSLFYTTNIETTPHSLFQYISGISALVLSVGVVILMLLRAGLCQCVSKFGKMTKGVELDIQRSVPHNSSVSSRTPFRRRNSSLPSLPEDPEYHTIPPPSDHTHPEHIPMHHIQVNGNEMAGVFPLGSESDTINDDEEMEENILYGSVGPPHIHLQPNREDGFLFNGLQQQGEDEELQDNSVLTENSQWFKEGTCSPIHHPFSPSGSSINNTPMPSSIGRSITKEEEDELDKLYQLARVGKPPAVGFNTQDATGQYAEIRSPRLPSPPKPENPPSYIESIDPTWYQAPPDSECNFGQSSKMPVATSSLHKYMEDNDTTCSLLFSPPPPLPPRLQESPVDDGVAIYAEINSQQDRG